MRQNHEENSIATPRTISHSETFSQDGYRSGVLARSITRSGSKLTFMIANLLVDRHLRADCYRAYAYLRWADDVIDDSSTSREERLVFVRRQQNLVRRLFLGQPLRGLSREEQIIEDLIRHDQGTNSNLRAFILGFLNLLEFDAFRKDQLISEKQLTWYSD